MAIQSFSGLISLWPQAVEVTDSSPLSTAPVVVRPPTQPIDTGFQLSTLEPNPTCLPTRPMQNNATSIPEITESTVVTTVVSDTLTILKSEEVPVGDPYELTHRLEGKQVLPQTSSPPAMPYEINDQQTFWISNTDTHETRQVVASLGYVTQHLYFWIEQGVSYNRNELRNLVEAFEAQIYPTNQRFFGNEWTPGIDGDPHIYVLYTRDLGYSIAGYYYSRDEYSPLVQEYSNAHEIIFLNADIVDLGIDYTYGILAHEYQHMIHWFVDRNETSWMNEGFSVLAAFLNGYDPGGFDFSYAQDPDVQLNDWPMESFEKAPHYGASFLFLTYFLDRFGEEATRALVADLNDGLESVDAVLAGINATNPLSGAEFGADDIFVDWVLASYLHDPSVGDGQYTYHYYPNAPKPGETEHIRKCPQEPITRDVHQYGVDYIRITCNGDHTLHFEGSYHVDLLPVHPYSGDYAFWSNRGEESDMTLTREFDFTNLNGPLTFTYWTWYDLERDFDYVYVEASRDGENLDILTTPSGTGEDPSGNSYGWGYTGTSGDGPIWIQEQVDISQYAGGKVFLRFEYVTDTAANGEGLLVDDIAIPEAGYFAGFESDQEGWVGEGFVRIQNTLPQAFRLALIKSGRQTEIEYITLGEDLTADIPINISGDVQEVILVVSGTTRFTRQTTAYRFSID